MAEQTGPQVPIRDLAMAVTDARAALHHAIRERIPVGTLVSVKRGDGDYYAWVIEHTDHDWTDHRVKVASEKSGKTYWVYAERLVEYRER